MVSERSEATQSSFTTSKATLNVETNFISVPEFIGNILLDVGLVVLSVILWRLFWYSLNKLQIWDLKRGQFTLVGRDGSLVRAVKSLYRILKNMSSLKNSYVMDQCGFQAYAYLYFLRRLTHLMAILTLTDLCLWVPYQLYFNDTDKFSLISMDSTDNQLFRTFYMLWVSIAVLYTTKEMKKYLKLMLKHRLLRSPLKHLNNLKSKTVFIHFVGERERISELELRIRLVETLKVEDTILACMEIENNSRKIEVEYEYKIYEIVKNLGLDYFHPVWKFFKGVETDKMETRIREKLVQASNERQTFLNSFLVAFENISTAEHLVNEFESTRSAFDMLPQGEENEVDRQANPLSRVIVSWAQQPADIMWINMGASEKVKLIKYVLFNSLSVILIVIGVLITVLSRSREIMDFPKIFLPMLLSIINSTLRWLISKSSQWENRHFQYELQMKEMKVLTIFFIINVLIGSLVRDTLNLIDILTTGWGWLELFRLVYKKPDGFFYYGFIMNEIAFTAFAVLFKMGDLFIEVFHSNFTYEKNTQIRHKSKYGTNDPFRYGYYYSLDLIIFAVIFMYSASSPLIHFFGFLYFYSKFYMNGYSLVLFHRYEETCSNLRILEKVCDYIDVIMISVIFLLGITMMFESQYPSVLILYFWEGVILYLIYYNKNSPHFLRDFSTDDELKKMDLTEVVETWEREYRNSMKPMPLIRGNF